MTDPRSEKNKNWNFGYLVSVLSYGIIGGSKKFRDVEVFSEGDDERIPDTTLHDVAIAIDPKPIRRLIVEGVKETLRQHELPKDEFPVRVTAIDGKCVYVSGMAVGEFSQRSECNNGEQYINRVLRAFHL